MARFKMQMPTEVIKEFQMVYNNTDEIFGEMTRAGAEVVEKNIIANVPQSIQKSNMMKKLKITKTYKTPSNDGIATKVGFFGKFIDEDGREKICEIVGNVFEYGRSNSPFPKHPFMRKSFKKKEIEKAMLDAQKKASGGILE